MLLETHWLQAAIISDEHVKLMVHDDHGDTTIQTDLIHAVHHCDGIPPCII